MPIDALMRSSRPSSATGSGELFLQLSQTCTASEALRSSGSSSTNSSPPWRVIVRLAKVLHQPSRDRDQHQVAALVTEGVVDGLEVIEIDEDHRDLVAFAAGAGEGALEAVIEEAAVGQAGQAVVRREILDLCHGIAALGDVGQRPDQPQR